MWVKIDANPIERIAIKVMTQTIVNPEQELFAQLLVKLQELEPHRQEQVLDFIEFLLSRQQQAHTQEQPIESKAPISALAAAGDLVGCLEAPSDLSI